MTGQSANYKMNQVERAEMKHLATHACISMHRMSSFPSFSEDLVSTLSISVRARVSYCITMCTAEPRAELAGSS